MTTEYSDAGMTQVLKETAVSVETMLTLQVGTTTGQSSSNVLTDAERKAAVQKARVYSVKDPLCKQAIRLWTDYSFGTGMTWNAEDEPAKKALDAFWNNPANAAVLSGPGQRKSSDKLLVDGEIFLAVFLGEETTIRRLDPLEITEIISDPDDLEDVRYYKREWTTPQRTTKASYYRSMSNEADKECPDSQGISRKSTEDALVYHLAINTLGQRGNSMLLPALDWVKLYRQFLASRVAVMLALARFAWKNKVQGGSTAVAAAKAVTHEQTPAAGSMVIENLGADLQPIRTDTGAQNAKEDGRMLRLQVCAAVGWPEQYFGDVSTGNLATAKTVELPVMKMCQSYQMAWASAYADIDQLVLRQAGVKDAYVDRDFPEITPEDAMVLAQSIGLLVSAFPELSESRDVMQRALNSLGITNVNEVLDALAKTAESSPYVATAKALRRLKEALRDR